MKRGRAPVECVRQWRRVTPPLPLAAKAGRCLDTASCERAISLAANGTQMC